MSVFGHNILAGFYVVSVIANVSLNKLALYSITLSNIDQRESLILYIIVFIQPWFRNSPTTEICASAIVLVPLIAMLHFLPRLFLDLQLKTRHQPYKLCRQWQDLLYRFTDASEEDISQGETQDFVGCK